jgi:hypothetical protein
MKSAMSSFARKKILGMIRIAAFAVAASFLAITQLPLGQAALGQSAPQVHLDAEGLAPRTIEELTGTTIVRHYAQAWRNLELALESGHADGLEQEFTGSAKDHLLRRIEEQNHSGVHVKIVDHGHQLKAIFYSTDGTAMQLLDQAQLEVQMFEGDKLLANENVPHQYMVLMTPGADRWYVRDLEEIPAKSF